MRAHRARAAGGGQARANRRLLLDVGTGTGTVAALAVAGGGRVAAADAKPTWSSFARGDVPGAEVVEGRLPSCRSRTARSTRWSRTSSSTTSPTPARTVTELLRLTAAGGRVAVTVWPHPAPPLQQLWADVMAAVGLTPSPSRSYRRS